ncbi:MAG: GntR family transcriptional regulator [Nakamurella sp.]
MRPHIDRTAPLPFYHQLKQILLADIQERQLAPGTRLPGDNELCQTYDLSRTVVRQALGELESDGVVERIKGRGTFVAKPKTTENWVQSLTGLFEDVAARGGHLRSEVRRQQVEPAENQLAADLQLPPGAPVILIERLRFVDDEPWALSVNHIPYDLAPGLEDDDLTNQSLYGLLENKYGVALKGGRRVVEAATAGAALAKSLQLTRGAAVLVIRSITLGADDRPVEQFVASHRGDRSRFEVDLVRRRSSRLDPLMHRTA